MPIKARLIFKAAAATLFLSGQAMAGGSESAHITQFFGDKITVMSDGQKYTQVKGPLFPSLKGRVEIDNTFATVKKWTVKPRVFYTYGLSKGMIVPMPTNSPYSVSKSYPFGSRPSTVGRNVEMPLHTGQLAAAAVAQCNAYADAQRQGGKSNAQIFSRDRNLALNVNLSLDVKYAGAEGTVFTGVGTSKTIALRCMKAPKGQHNAAGSLADQIQVEHASLDLRKYATQGGACMVELIGAIRTNRAGAKIKFRYAHTGGRKSQVFTAKAAGNRIAVVKHQWDIPNGPGVETGGFRIEGVSPKFDTNWKAYSMDCSTGSPGGFSPTPGKPRHAAGDGKLKIERRN